jgi:hypothetical protein
VNFERENVNLPDVVLLIETEQVSDNENYVLIVLFWRSIETIVFTYGSGIQNYRPSTQ